MRTKWTREDGSRMECFEPGCESPIRNSGYCSRHYQKHKRDGTARAATSWFNPDGSRRKCQAPGCTSDVFSSGWCQKHYTRMYRYGTLDAPPDRNPECAVPGCVKRMLPTSDICKACYQKSWRYGLSPSEYIEMSQPANKHCHNPGCGSTERLHLDHDHSCCKDASSLRGGKKACGNCVRGWLCSNCNTALGLLQDDQERLAGLINYLDRWTKR